MKVILSLIYNYTNTVYRYYSYLKCPDLFQYDPNNLIKNIHRTDKVSVIRQGLLFLVRFMHQYSLLPKKVDLVACQYGHVHLLDFLKSVKFNFNIDHSIYNRKHNIDIIAALYGQLDCFKWIVSKKFVSKDYSNKSLWLTAIKHNRLEILKWASTKGLINHHDIYLMARMFDKDQIVAWLSNKFVTDLPSDVECQQYKLHNSYRYKELALTVY